MTCNESYQGLNQEDLGNRISQGRYSSYSRRNGFVIVEETEVSGVY